MINIFNVMNFVYHFIIARMMTPADYGVLVTLFSLIYIFGVPSEAIQIIYSRLTSKYLVEKKEGKIKSLVRRGLKKGFIISLILLIFLIFLSIFISQFLNIDFWLIIFLFIMFSFIIIIERFLNGYNAFKIMKIVKKTVMKIMKHRKYKRAMAKLNKLRATSSRKYG